MDEWEFVSAVAERSDSLILLDLSNIISKAIDHNFSPLDYLRQLPADRIWEVHLTPPQERQEYQGDADDATAPDSSRIWALYRETSGTNRPNLHPARTGSRHSTARGVGTGTTGGTDNQFTDSPKLSPHPTSRTAPIHLNDRQTLAHNLLLIKPKRRDFTKAHPSGSICSMSSPLTSSLKHAWTNN